MNPSLNSSNLEIDLSRFDALVQNETADRPKADTMPDGRYDARIEDVELGVSPKSGNPVLKYTLRVIGPTYVNRVLWKRCGITENTVQYAMDELNTCGLHLQKFSDLKRFMHQVIGTELSITRKTRGEYVNIYFNRATTTGVAKSDEADDDLPF